MKIKSTLACAIVLVSGSMMNIASAEIEGNPEKIPGWVFVYEHDSDGVATDGNISRLIKAIESGADIKIGRGDANYYETIDCDTAATVNISGTEYVQCRLMRFSLFSDSINMTFRNPPYTVYEFQDTRGVQGVARASIYGGASLGQTVASIGARWYARVR